MIGVPTLAEVRAWVNVPATSVSDPDLQAILDAELAIQARLCRVPADDPVGPASLVIDGFEGTVTVVAGPPGRTYRILWGDGTDDVVLDANGDATVVHTYTYAGNYPAAVYDVDLDRYLVNGIVPVPSNTVLPAQGVYPSALARACLRRCQRQVAARNVPLGVLGVESDGFGPLNLPAWDAEIARLEASYKIPVIA